VEREFRAQLSAVINAGLSPARLDWHCPADGGHNASPTLPLSSPQLKAAPLWSLAAQNPPETVGFPPCSASSAQQMNAAKTTMLNEQITLFFARQRLGTPPTIKRI